MFLIIMSTLSQFTSTQIPKYTVAQISISQVLSLLSFLIILSLTTLLIIGRCFPRSHFFKFYFDSLTYPIFYIIYQASFITVFTLLYANYWCVYLLIAMTVANIVFLIILRPYQEHFHNVGVILNQVLVLLGEGICLLQVVMSSNADYES